MDLAKAFYTVKQALSLVQLDAYGFSRAFLKPMQNNVFNRHQKSSINGSLIV